MKSRLVPAYRCTDVSYFLAEVGVSDCGVRPRRSATSSRSLGQPEMPLVRSVQAPPPAPRGSPPDGRPERREVSESVPPEPNPEHSTAGRTHGTITAATSRSTPHASPASENLAGPMPLGLTEQ